MSNGRVGDLTVDELRAVIRETVRETLEALFSDLDEDDAERDLTFRPDIAAELRAYLAARPAGRSLDDIARELGLQH